MEKKKGKVSNIHISDIYNLSKFNIDNIDYPSPLDNIKKISEKHIKEQKTLLNFLKATTLEQSKTAEKQERNNKRMTLLALVFAFISIVPIIKEWFLPSQTKNLYQNIFELEKRISSESERNLEMYKSLLDLQNQVKILEKENALLKKINSLTKQKN